MGKGAKEKSSLKPSKRSGTFEKDQLMIVCLHQRKGSVTLFDVPQTIRQPLLGTVRRNVKLLGSMVYTDDFRPYKFFFRVMDTGTDLSIIPREGVRKRRCACQ